MQPANEPLPVLKFVAKYHELHTILIEATTIAEAAKQLEAVVAKLPKGSMMLEIRSEHEPEAA